MKNPEQHALNRVSWQFFATLTFKREEMSEGRRMKLFFAWARRVSGWFKVYFPRLKWALRLEEGEQNGRLHYHVLIAGLPENAVQQTTCYAMEKLWDKSMRVGFAVVRTWAAGRDAVAYITKGSSDFSLIGANQYEANKFGGRCVVTVSESLLRISNGDEFRSPRHHGTAPKGLNSSLHQGVSKDSKLRAHGSSPYKAQAPDLVATVTERSSGHVKGDTKGLQKSDAVVHQANATATKQTSKKANWKSAGNGLFIHVD